MAGRSYDSANANNDARNIPLKLQLTQYLRNARRALIELLESQLKRWTQPSNISLVTGVFTDLVRSKGELIAENALLRQQLIILKRQHERPAITSKDRSLLVILASQVRHWKDALVVVKPETLLKCPSGLPLPTLYRPAGRATS